MNHSPKCIFEGNELGNNELTWSYRDQPIILTFYLLCYAPVLKFLTYYAQYYAHVKELYLKFDCFIIVYLRFYILQLYK